MAVNVLRSTLDGGEWLTSRPGQFTPEKKSWYVLKRRLDGPQSRPAGLREEKVLFNVQRLIRNSADLFL